VRNRTRWSNGRPTAASAAARWCSAPMMAKRSCGNGLKVYHRQTKPLVDYYSGRPTFKANRRQPPAGHRDGVAR
jgi:adenylate kinase family enzyme